jgi:hypothetical protein
MNNDISRRTDGSLVLTVFGNNWAQIQRKARKITGLPDGIISFEPGFTWSNQLLDSRMQNGKKVSLAERLLRGRYHATVMVTPNWNQSAPMSPLATLRRQQGVSPVGDIKELLGPETDDDFGSFVEAITTC